LPASGKSSPRLILSLPPVSLLFLLFG
jgi:hypothetical protein